MFLFCIHNHIIIRVDYKFGHVVGTLLQIIPSFERLMLMVIMVSKCYTLDPLVVSRYG